MPSKSKSQQRFFGMVDAYKKGELENPSQAIKDAADGMSMKDVKKFAKTKHKGLPNHVKKKKIKEGTERQELLKVQRRIYSIVNKNFGGIFRDDAWQNVKRLRDAIQDVEGVNDVEMWAGEYHNYLMSANYDKSPYRDYKTIVLTDFGKLVGYIRCCAAGTMEDPFSAYDVVISLYPEDTSRFISESQLNQVIQESIRKVLGNIL